MESCAYARTCLCVRTCMFMCVRFRVSLSVCDWYVNSLKGKLNAKNKYGLSEGELGTDSDELCLEPIREEELCQIS